MSRKGQYDVVAVAFWIVVLEGGCELQAMRGRGRRNIQEPAGPAPAAAAVVRPSTASGARPRVGPGLGGRQQWDAPLGGGLAVSQDLEGLAKAGAGSSSSFWEKVTGVGKGAAAAQFTLHLDRSPYVSVSLLTQQLSRTVICHLSLVSSTASPTLPP